MTDREAMQQALSALEFNLPVIEDFGSKEQLTDCHRAITALYKSLAQPEQEPVAWKKSYDIVCALLRQAHDILATTQYPIKREWVGLTDEEILSAAEEVPITCIRQRDYDLHFAPIIEAKLKEKNGG